MSAALVNSWWFLTAIGVAAGVLSGLFGVGGGTIMVPALVLLVGLTQQGAQGASLAAMVPMAVLGAWRYWNHPGIGMSWRVILLVAAGALLGTLFGTHLALRLPGALLRRVFAVFMIFVAVRMLISPPKARPAAEPAPAPASQAASPEDAASKTPG